MIAQTVTDLAIGNAFGRIFVPMQNPRVAISSVNIHDIPYFFATVVMDLQPGQITYFAGQVHRFCIAMEHLA
ncbi:hypothetical protein D3C71_1700730 [compost metagenome]